MTYIKELIEIPDQVGRGDFVLKLSAGVTDPEATVRHYQVTPQLVQCFDQALNLVKGAITGQGGRTTSKASYLHGSFGSGKSHFMAILYLILAGDHHARSIPELSDVIAKHSDWIQGRKFLMVPYHMMNSRNLESRILGDYADYMGRTHPDAPTPSVFLAEGILENAEQLRLDMGDEKFFGKLNRGKASQSSGWGSLSAGWDEASYTRARQAAHNSEDCRRLVRDLVDTHLPAMKNTEEFVDLDDGLVEISRHARELGYDAVVLFLDELILWLASYAADQTFISRESNKVVKLVESSRADRPVPLISFIARQRDLRDLIGKQIAGAEKLAFSDVLSYSEGRFGVINLEDRNLPAIARKRILLPKSNEAAQMMDVEFERTRSLREDVMKVLLTKEANREDFRQLYPFSPALVETLVAVSSLLQRERTALKVMAMLLSEQKDTLRLGQIVPVGDLFDQVSQGDEAFSSDMKTHFDNANRLYQQYLKPLLESEHELSFDEAAMLDWDDPKRKALRNDDRLMKTLLLSALVPAVESLKNMTPQKLAALNHGTIQSPIPGQEANTVLAKFKRWAAAAGQIKVREGAGQKTLAIQISSIDTEQILAKAEGVDNRGNRIAKLKELIFGELGRDNEDHLYYTHEFKWRGTPRRTNVVFTNVRDLASESLKGDEDCWRIIIDYPFDDQNHSVRDDIDRIEKFLSEEEPTRTICWLPSFFNHDSLQALGILVRLEHILKENQFPSYVQHLADTDRETARSQLESQREQLRSQIIERIHMAYGILEGGDKFLDESNTLEAAEQYRSLDPRVTLQPPVAATLGDALMKLLDQALRQQFPAHPKFDQDIRLTPSAVQRVLEVFTEACRTAEPSLLVDTRNRKDMAQIANPLKLGEMGEQRFQVGEFWRSHFNRESARDPGTITVAKLRRWIDQPEARGLPEILQDLIILAWAEQTNKTFRYMGGPETGRPGQLKDAMELLDVALPDEKSWQDATQRSRAIFGVETSPLLNPANVGSLSEKVGKRIEEYFAPLENYTQALKKIMSEAFPGRESDRLRTAQLLLDMMSGLRGVTGKDLIQKLAASSLPPHHTALLKAIGAAREMAPGLRNYDWSILIGIRDLADEGRTEAQLIWAELEKALCSDEHVVSLGVALPKLQSRAVALLTRKTSAGPATVPVPPPPVAPGPTPVPRPEPQPHPQPHPQPAPPAAQFLRNLYRTSQVENDGFPDWVPQDIVRDLLTIHNFGRSSDGSEVSTMVVVSPMMKALIDSDPGASLDLGNGYIDLPRFGKKLRLTVRNEHLSGS